MDIFEEIFKKGEKKIKFFKAKHAIEQRI